jgi:hypothetical protein
MTALDPMKTGGSLRCSVSWPLLGYTSSSFVSDFMSIVWLRCFPVSEEER